LIDETAMGLPVLKKLLDLLRQIKDSALNDDSQSLSVFKEFQRLYKSVPNLTEIKAMLRYHDQGFKNMEKQDWLLLKIISDIHFQYNSNKKVPNYKVLINKILPF